MPYRPLLALPLLGLLAACVSTPIIPPASACSKLIPEAWGKGVDPVPLPGFDTVGEVLTAFIDQSARLQSANDRQRDTISIVRNCEELINQARPRKKVLGVL